MTNSNFTEGLQLEGDRSAITCPSLTGYLAGKAAGHSGQQSLIPLIEAIFTGATRLARRIAAGNLPGDPARLIGANTDGDQQKSLDVGSHLLFTQLLTKAGAAAILSEEADAPIFNPSGGKYAVAIDPLDGSGNVGLGAPLGTLFSILPHTPSADPFLVAGRKQVAAGYIAYGNTVDFGLAIGKELVIGTMEPQTGIFYVLRQKVRLKPAASMIAFNASVYRHLLPGMHAYVDDIFHGAEGPRGKNFNMRWLAASVGELHRILTLGNGLFFYVEDRRPGYEKGRLRHIYEASPIAFICKAAGGKATDGVTAILDRVPDSYHGRIPLVFGSADEVDIVARYHAEHAALKKTPG